MTDSSSDHELENPTSVQDRFFLYVDGPAPDPDPNGVIDYAESYGKWIVTQPLENIDKTWRVIGKAVQSEQLECLQAKCSTVRYNPDCFGPGPLTIASICVYTSKDTVDKIGFQLIELVQHDIYYKTDAATLKGIYTHTGSASNSFITTLYWNGGEPSYEMRGEALPGWDDEKRHDPKEDRWQLNCVRVNELIGFASKQVHGRWVAELEYGEVTEFWHRLRDRVESGELGVTKMVCPPKVKWSDPDEKPRLVFFTAEQMRDKVGSKLERIFKTGLTYETVDHAK